LTKVSLKNEKRKASLLLLNYIKLYTYTCNYAYMTIY